MPNTKTTFQITKPGNFLLLCPEPNTINEALRLAFRQPTKEKEQTTPVGAARSEIRQQGGVCCRQFPYRPPNARLELRWARSVTKLSPPPPHGLRDRLFGAWELLQDWGEAFRGMQKPTQRTSRSYCRSIPQVLGHWLSA
jgi:hypothetical protein